MIYYTMKSALFAMGGCFQNGNDHFFVYFLKNICRIKYFDLSLHYQNKKQVSQSNTTDMEATINSISAQAVELLKNQHIVAMLNECATEEERQMKLALAAMHAIAKANC